jgi:signal transduction histidine kinase
MKTKANTVEWSQRYQKALSRYLLQGLPLRVQPALKLGCQAAALGMETLALAQIHEQALLSNYARDSSARTRKGLATQAKHFFNEANSAIEKTHVAALKQEGRVNQLTRTLLNRTAESKVSLQRLKRGIFQRKQAEAALLKSGADHAKLLQISDRLRTLVRDQTHAILLTQEKERKKISQGLQDTVAQTLLGINIELLALKASDKARTDRFAKELDSMNREVGLEPKKRK